MSLRVVAFGGGHGLSASLRGLRRCARELDLEITAIVTVGDDGGSSGRLRAERDALVPPGDLRQALAALAADDPQTHSRPRSRCEAWADSRMSRSWAVSSSAIATLRCLPPVQPTATVR